MAKGSPPVSGREIAWTGGSLVFHSKNLPPLCFPVSDWLLLLLVGLEGENLERNDALKGACLSCSVSPLTLPAFIQHSAIFKDSRGLLR